MHYRPLGKSGFSISIIGFGCMSLKKNNNDNERVIHHAIASGINYFDTADIYQNGENEVCLGKAVRPFRNKIIIASKVGNMIKQDGTGLAWNPSKPHIIASAETSLKRLQTDYIDLYQLHGGTIEDPIDETIDAFETLKKQGKIRHFGISSIRPNVIREYVKRSNMVSVMMQYSLLDRRPEETILPLLEENNIGVLARGCLASGLLIDKPPRAFLSYSSEEVAKASNAISTLRIAGRDSTQIAIRFSLSQQAIVSAIVGIRSMEQLEEAIKTVYAPALTQYEISYLKNILKPERYQQHR
ncbi:MAG: aldo/keto reductase [Bacteroidetes bacterium]|nr:aldo/keto reductase [Bacteroidota bacterium]